MITGCEGAGERNGMRLFLKVGGAVACVLCMLLSTSGVMAAGETNWTKEKVAENGTIDPTWISMALDGNGNPGIVYHTHNAGTNFSYLDSGSWKHELIDPVAYGGGRGIAWDGNTWMVAYGSGVLKFAERDPVTKSWSIKTIEKTGVYDNQKGIGIYNTNGNYKVGISYCKSGLKYAEYDGSAWTTTLLDRDAKATYSDVKFGSNGEPSIAYCDQTKGRGELSSTNWIKYAKRSSGTWSISTIASGSDKHYGWSIDMDLDSSNHPYIVDPAYLYYNSGSGWTKEQVTSYTSWASLALDESGGTVIPYVAHLTESTNRPMVSKKVNGAWVAETVDSNTYAWNLVVQFYVKKDANNNIVLKKLNVSFGRANPYIIYCASRDLLNPSTWG